MTWERSSEVKRNYTKKYPERRRLTNKLAWLRVRYGEDAVDHFLAHPACEECSEARFAALAIHHPEGREVDLFQTLCMNCHSVHHGGPWTLADCIGMKVRGEVISARSSMGRTRSFQGR